MRCPFCAYEDTQVKDSRTVEEGAAIRRRRICPQCHARFTTCERVQIREMTVIKKNNSRVPFDREKLAKSVYVATSKRQFSSEDVELLVNQIQQKLERLGQGEISSELIGRYVMQALLAIDKVAYIRYASVYNNFTNAQDFEDFIALLRQESPK